MRLGAAPPSLACLFVLAACTASVDPEQRDGGSSGPCVGVTCNEGFVCLDGACVPADPCDGVECDGANERCSGGRCVSCEADQDGDNFEACVDCDDSDPVIVPGSEAPCESACGIGSVRCLGLAGWSNCTAPIDCDCTAGETRTEPCGRCGMLVRTCGADGRWGDPGACEEAGDCVPGTVSSESCGDDCTERERECTPGCTWGAWGDCTNQGECTAGQTETSACPDVGQRTRTCGADCTWGGWSECGQGECAPGAQENEACGNCGTRTRTCGADGFWGDWGGCGGEGPCVPGQSEDDACGNCGARSRTCGADCQWSDWGGCGGEGACAPGARRDSGNCDACAEQVCNDQCSWGGCALRDGAECEWEEGTHFRCCGGGQWQFCLGTTYGCVWSDQCVSCSGCGC